VSEDIDFSPFNSEALLAALSSLLLSSRLISFAYAGDVQGLCERIGRVFYSQRCLLFLKGQDSQEVEVFEFAAGEVKQVGLAFSGFRGQELAQNLLKLQDPAYFLEEAQDLSSLLSENCQGAWIDVAGAFACGPVHLFPLAPLENKEDARGLLLLAQEAGEIPWNKVVRDSLVIVADYLTKLLEVEDCHRQLQLLTLVDAKTGFYTKQGFLQTLKKEIEVAHYFNDQGSLLLIGLELAPELRGTKYGEEIFALVLAELKASLRTVDQVAHLASLSAFEQLAVHMPRISAMESRQRLEGFLDNCQRSIDGLMKKNNSSFRANLKIGLSGYTGKINEETLVAQVQEALARACRQSGTKLVEMR
jgi:GGDEF domain-containing protein